MEAVAALVAIAAALVMLDVAALRWGAEAPDEAADEHRRRRNAA